MLQNDRKWLVTMTWSGRDASLRPVKTRCPYLKDRHSAYPARPKEDSIPPTSNGFWATCPSSPGRSFFIMYATPRWTIRLAIFIWSTEESMSLGRPKTNWDHYRVKSLGNDQTILTPRSSKPHLTRLNQYFLAFHRIWTTSSQKLRMTTESKCSPSTKIPSKVQGMGANIRIT